MAREYFTFTFKCTGRFATLAVAQTEATSEYTCRDLSKLGWFTSVTCTAIKGARQTY